MSKGKGTVTEAQWAKALSHPLRAAILQRLGQRVESPGALAEELGAPLGVVSYHVRMLRDYGMVELVRTEPRRGALQHYYRATVRQNDPDFDLLLTQLATLFGVPEKCVTINGHEEPGLRTYEVQVLQSVDNMRRKRGGGPR